MAGSDLQKLQWEVEYIGPKGVLKTLEPGEAINLGEETYFAVRGKLPKDLPLVYVLQMSAKTQIVRIGLMARVKQLKVKAGGEVRLPQAGAFIHHGEKGSIHVVAVKRVLTREKLARLIGGREPPPEETTRNPT
jgi:hypothetical protein